MSRVSTMVLGSALFVAAVAGAAEDKPAKDKAAKKEAAEPYEGFKADQALLRKHLIHKAKDGGKDTKASSREACEAARRIFSRISFLYHRTRSEVLALLADPATTTEYNNPAGKGPTSPLVYVFDSGWGGYRYTSFFGELLGRVGVTTVALKARTDRHQWIASVQRCSRGSKSETSA